METTAYPLTEVGLDYLTLNRNSASISGGNHSELI
jgi:excinuclease UvrABC ATPase subunit